MLSVIAGINWPIMACAGAAIVILNKVLHKEQKPGKIDDLAEEPAPAPAPEAAPEAAQLETNAQVAIAEPEAPKPVAEPALSESDFESPVKAFVTKVPSIPPSPLKAPITHTSVAEEDLIRALSGVAPSATASPTPKVKVSLSSRLKKALSKKGSKKTVKA